MNLLLPKLHFFPDHLNPGDKLCLSIGQESLDIIGMNIDMFVWLGIAFSLLMEGREGMTEQRYK